MKALCVSNAETAVYPPFDIHRELQSAHGSPHTISLTMMFLKDQSSKCKFCYLCVQPKYKSLPKMQLEISSYFPNSKIGKKYFVRALTNFIMIISTWKV